MQPPIPELQPEEPPLPYDDGTANRAAYNFVADKVGFVPNVRRSDNALQAKVFLGVWAGCILLGTLLGKGDGAMLGLLLGLVVALLVSGTVLAVVGLRRK